MFECEKCYLLRKNKHQGLGRIAVRDHFTEVKLGRDMTEVRRWEGTA